MKYIIFNINKIETPVLFPVTLGHDEVARALGQDVVSAGFCKPNSDTTEYDCMIVQTWSAYGSSSTLKVSARPQDAEIIMQAMERNG